MAKCFPGPSRLHRLGLFPRPNSTIAAGELILSEHPFLVRTFHTGGSTHVEVLTINRQMYADIEHLGKADLNRLRLPLQKTDTTFEDITADEFDRQLCTLPSQFQDFILEVFRCCS